MGQLVEQPALGEGEAGGEHPLAERADQPGVEAVEPPDGGDVVGCGGGSGGHGRLSGAAVAG